MPQPDNSPLNMSLISLIAIVALIGIPAVMQVDIAAIRDLLV